MKEDTLINRMNTFIHERKTNTTTPTQAVQRDDIRQELTHSEKISHVERMIAQLVVRHGERMVFHNVETEDGRLIDISVAQFIYYTLAADDIKLTLSAHRFCKKQPRKVASRALLLRHIS